MTRKLDAAAGRAWLAANVTLQHPATFKCAQQMLAGQPDLGQLTSDLAASTPER